MSKDKSARQARETLIKKRDWRTDVNEAGEVVILRRGEEKAPNGDQYSGEFLDGEKHGRGRMRFAGGNVYDGKIMQVASYCLLCQKGLVQENGLTVASMGMATSSSLSLLRGPSAL